MAIELIIAFVLLGIVVGIMAGLLGIGGGGIMVPVLASIFMAQGMPKESVIHFALGTSMACIILTSFSSMRAHHKNGAVNWSLVKQMAGGVIVGTFSATFLTAYLNAKTLAIFFAVFMVYVSINMFRHQKMQTGAGDIHRTELSFVTLGIGAISALVSIGGGSLTVPYLTWRGIHIKHAIATSAALGFFIAIAGTLGYFINGELNTTTPSHPAYTWGYLYLPAVLLVSIPSYFTAPLGAKLTQRLPVGALRKIFGVLLITLSLKMLASFV